MKVLAPFAARFHFQTSTLETLGAARNLLFATTGIHFLATKWGREMATSFILHHFIKHSKHRRVCYEKQFN